MTTPKSEPIFILAAGRSGSTLLRYMLDSHRDVSSPGALFLGQLCSWLVTSLPRLWPSGNIGADSQVQSEVLLEARRIVDQIMAGYLSRTGKRLWCEKTPANLGHLSSMAQIFPEARYICLYRSCLDTISS